MQRYNQIFRTRIDDEMQEDLAKGLTKWKKTHNWERPGVFCRLILELGLKAYNAQK